MRNLRKIYFFEHFAEIIPYIQEKKSKTSSISQAQWSKLKCSQIAPIISSTFFDFSLLFLVCYFTKNGSKSRFFLKLRLYYRAVFLTFVPKSSLFLHKKCKKKKVTFFLKMQPKKDMYLRRDRAHLIHRFLWYPKMKSQRPIVNPNRHEIKTQQFTFAFQC